MTRSPHLLSFALAAAGAFLLVVAPSGCGPVKPKCTAATCSGCCDAAGTCQFGGVDSACGFGGALCTTCAVAQTCQLGFCVNIGGSGGGSGGGGGSTGGGTGGGGTGGGAMGGGAGGGAMGGGAGGGAMGGGAGGGAMGGGAGGGAMGGGAGGGTGGGGPQAGDLCSGAQTLPFSGGQAFASGSTSGYFHDRTSSCGSSSGPDRFYVFQVTTPSLLNASLEVSSTTVTPVLSLFTGACSAETACSTGDGPGSAANLIDVPLNAGTYTLEVGTLEFTATGYSLIASLTSGPPPTDGGTTTDAGVTSLSNGVPVTVSGATGSLTYYSFNVTSSSQITASMVDGPSGDADLYLSQGALPDTSVYDYYSGEIPPSGEMITVPSPPSGTWYLAVYGYSAFSGAQLTVTW